MANPQRGNILFLILLAIVLFVALTYAIQNSDRGNKGTDDERISMLAAQLVENASLMETAVRRAMLVDNVPEYAFDFNGEQSNSNTNNTCTLPSCRIYTTKGGGVPPLRLPDWASADTTNADTRRKAWIQLWSVVGVGTDQPDLLLHYGFLTTAMCKAVNKAVGAENFDLVTTDSFQPGEATYTGTLLSMPAATAVVGDTHTGIIGRRSLCINTGNKGNSFYTVLIAR